MTQKEIADQLVKNLVRGIVKNVSGKNIAKAIAPFVARPELAVFATQSPETYQAVKNISPARRSEILEQAAWNKRPLHEKIGSEILSGGMQAGAEMYKGIGNTIGAISDVAEPMVNPGGWIARQGMQKQIGQPIQSPGQWIAGQSGQLAKNIESTTDQVVGPTRGIGKGIGGVTGFMASQVPGMVLGMDITNKVQGAQSLSKLPNIVKSLLGNVAGGAVATEGIVAAGEGRMANPQEMLLGGGIDAGATLLGGIFGRLGKNAYTKLLGITPKQAGKLANTGVDVAGEMAKKGYFGTSKKAIAKKVSKDITKLSNQLDDLIRQADNVSSSSALAKMDDTFSGYGFKAQDLLDGVDDFVFKSPKLKPKFGEMSAVKKQIANSLDEFIETVGDRALTLTEVQALKKKLGNSLSKMFARAGDAKSTARELVNDAIRKNAKEIIEANVKGAAALNQQMRPLIEGEKMLTSKGDYSGTLGDLLLGAGVGSAGLASGQKPEDILRNVLGVLFIKNFGMSPMGRSLRGSVFGQLGKVSGSAVTRQLLKNLVPKP